MPDVFFLLYRFDKYQVFPDLVVWEHFAYINLPFKYSLTFFSVRLNKGIDRRTSTQKNRPKFSGLTIPRKTIVTRRNGSVAVALCP